MVVCMSAWPSHSETFRRSTTPRLASPAFAPDAGGRCPAELELTWSEEPTGNRAGEPCPRWPSTCTDAFARARAKLVAP